MTTNIFLGRKSMASLDTDINQFQTKRKSPLQKINTLETTTESMGWPVIIVIIPTNANGLGKRGRMLVFMRWIYTHFWRSYISNSVNWLP